MSNSTIYSRYHHWCIQRYESICYTFNDFQKYNILLFRKSNWFVTNKLTTSNQQWNYYTKNISMISVQIWWTLSHPCGWLQQSHAPWIFWIWIQNQTFESKLNILEHNFKSKINSTPRPSPTRSSYNTRHIPTKQGNRNTFGLTKSYQPSNSEINTIPPFFESFSQWSSHACEWY